MESTVKKERNKHYDICIYIYIYIYIYMCVHIYMAARYFIINVFIWPSPN